MRGALSVPTLMSISNSATQKLLSDQAWSLAPKLNLLWRSSFMQAIKPACQCRRYKRCGFDPWVRKIPMKRSWQPIPVFFFFFYSSILAWRIPMDRGAWGATVHRVAQSQTWLKQLSRNISIHLHKWERTMLCNSSKNDNFGLNNYMQYCSKHWVLRYSC